MNIFIVAFKIMHLVARLQHAVNVVEMIWIHCPNKVCQRNVHGCNVRAWHLSVLL